MRGSLGHGGGGDFHEAEDDVGPLDDVMESEEPGGEGQEDAAGGVESEMGGHGDDADRAQLVAGEEAVGDGADAEDDRQPGCGAVMGEAEEPGGGDEQEADRIVEDAVNASGDEIH